MFTPARHVRLNYFLRSNTRDLHDCRMLHTRKCVQIGVCSRPLCGRPLANGLAAARWLNLTGGLNVRRKQARRSVTLVLHRSVQWMNERVSSRAGGGGVSCREGFLGAVRVCVCGICAAQPIGGAPGERGKTSCAMAAFSGFAPAKLGSLCTLKRRFGAKGRAFDG